MATEAATIPLSLDGYTDLPAGKIANVVTYLRIGAPPEGSPERAPDLSLRQVADPDPAWYRDLFRRVGADWLWYSLLVMPDVELRRLLADPLVEVHVLERHGEAIGVAELDRRTAGTVEIVVFGLVPEAIGTGAARFFMDAVLRVAFTPATGSVWLHTCTFDHPAALRFYLRAGFTAYKYAIEVTDDPRLSGHLPETAAPHVPLIRPAVDRPDSRG